MVRAIEPARGPSGGPSPMGLADLMETILDKGMVIDSYVTASLTGVDGLTVAARMVVASLNAYACLRFADAAARLDISREKEGPPDAAGGNQHGGPRTSPKEGWSQHETHSASSPQVPPRRLDGLTRGKPSRRMAPASTTPGPVSFRAPASGRRRAVPFSVAVVNPAAAGIGRGPEFPANTCSSPCG